MPDVYDLAVIGAGSAGLTAAGFAAQLGVRLILIEKERIGGDCTWTGCVPSKTLLKTARVIHQMRKADRYGLTPVNPEIDFKKIMAHVKDVISRVYEEETPEILKAGGIETLMGDVRFIDSHSVRVGEKDVEASRFLITTGASSVIPSINGLNTVNYLTYETIWDIEELPERLIIIGGGPIGCEMAQSFKRLGSEVTLLEAGEQILPRDDISAVKLLSGLFVEEGITLRINAPVEKVRQEKDGIHVFADGKEFTGDALLVAAGRRPNVDNMDLGKAGVDYNNAGIKVDGQLRTSQRHIYAAGDCAGGFQFTHYAAWQAATAVRNAMLPGFTKGIKEHVPWATFTDPEVAQAGLTEFQAREKYGDAVMTCEWPMDKVDRAITDGDTTGFLKLVHKKDGTVLGATVVCERAGDVVHEWIVALECGLKIGDLTDVIHIYPTYSAAGMQAAAEIRVAQLMGGMSGKLIRGAVHFMR